MARRPDAGRRTRRAAAALLIAAVWAAPALAGFGLPETQGLLHVRSDETTGLGALGFVLGESYYYQDVGQSSRYHWYTMRLGLAFGLGEAGHVTYDQRLVGLMRFAAPQDGDLSAAIGDSDWTAGLGDADLGLKLALPLPGSRLHLAAEGALRLPVGDTQRRFSSESRDYEAVGILSVDLLRGGSFVPTRLHLNAGIRANRGRLGSGLGPTPTAAGWQGVYPPYVPALEDGLSEDRIRQGLFGVGLEFLGTRMRLYGELSVDLLYQLESDAVMTRREEPWRLGLGFRSRGPWNLEFSGGFDLDLSRDDFDTAFVPEYPGLVTSIAVRKDWQALAGDPDGDGIRGDDDLCPDRPEDLDGFEDADGCPDPDNDRDGVPDLIDLAPNLPEDIDGFEDGDGRPDLDNDNDGIPDDEDLCPDRPEDYDGVEDDDGCPDRASAPPLTSPGVPAAPAPADSSAAPTDSLPPAPAPGAPGAP
ncbi:MAG: hypothetical protein R3C71_12320 [Candidatus Krumholzibacteriia bacterium]